MEISVSSGQRVELIDITDKVREKVSISDGILVVYTPHTTTGIFVNENDGPLVSDVEKVLGELAPQGAGYAHDPAEGNADAHIRGILLGNSAVLPVSGGKLELGTWQSIFFFEGDGPRSRRIIIKQIQE
jgi:secondary thiamine-phosphate synthase enzyme